MCGIAGIYSFQQGQAEDTLRVVQTMTSAIAHRGPDDDGFYADGPVTLGMRRLSIIDLASGQQPIPNEDKSVWVVLNGEIYNYRELRQDLLQAGHHLRTQSDTEVLVHLYEEQGADFVLRLNGMFAIALWDQKRQTLFLVRDRLGVKPLYYYHEPGRRLIFASEIKAILTVPRLHLDLDLQALYHYLVFRYVSGPRTMFRAVKKLLPGHMLVIRPDGVRDTEYWDIRHAKDRRTPDQYLEEFAHLLADSVAKRLISDVPVGIFLSGGLDSSAVTTLAAGLASGPLKSFSVAVDTKGELNEHAFARQVATLHGTDHHELTLSAGDFQQALTDFVWFMDEPVADPASIPLYYLARAARSHVTVVLSGEGSDELFAGYSTDMTIYRRAHSYQRIPPILRRHLLQPIARALFGADRVRDFLDTVERPLSDLNLRHPLAGMGLSQDLPNTLKTHLLTDEVAASIDFNGPDDLLTAYYRKTDATDFLDQRLYVTTKIWLPDDLLTKADKMTMAHSLELRVPFLDYRIVEFAASLPPSLRLQKVGRRTYLTKPLLRRLMAGKLPAALINRKKWGFMNPALPWLDGELREITQDTLRSARFRQRGWFNLEFVDKNLEGRGDPSYPHNRLLWKLLVLELWCRGFHDRVQGIHR